MPDIGLIELALIGLIAFLVLGPERLPDFFAQIARVVRQGRAWMTNIKMQLDQEKQQLAQPLEEVQQAVESSVEEVKADLDQEKKK